MSEEIDTDDLGTTEITPVELLPGTFKDCWVDASSSSARIKNSELLFIADRLAPIYRQTATLFCWASGATKQGEVTDATIGHFCSVMQLIDCRFGSNPNHFEGAVEDAVEAARKNGLRPHDRSTIARHRNRLGRLRNYSLPRLEARVRSPGWIRLDTGEAAHLDAADGHRGFLVVERFGTINSIFPLTTFDLMMQASSSPKVLAPILLQEAARVAAAQQEEGRAFVATRHHDQILIIQGFWNALQA